MQKNNQSPKDVIQQQPAVNCNFMLRVNGVYDLPCHKISSISQELEYETIQEGGINDYVHMLRKPVSKPFTFEVERYVCARHFDPLPMGIRLDTPLVLYVSRYANQFDQASREFTFYGCIVTGKTYGEMNAMASELLTETIKISYQRMEVSDNMEEDTFPTWKFAQNGAVLGEGKRRANLNPAALQRNTRGL